jgi:selenide, water dikinase
MDDAALVRPLGSRIDHQEGAALVMTIDVITPIVDDPRAFGSIAAANALSDVYAMGGSPQVALAYVGFPCDTLGTDMLAEVIGGLTETARRAGCAIVGGHTLIDDEPKCGLSVTGTVDPDRAWTHRGATPGHALVLTKPIGTGVIGQAIKKEVASAEQIAIASAHMISLNDVARDVGLEFGASTATDITGFGLLGHLRHLVEGSRLGATLQADRIPFLPGVRELANRGIVPGGSRRNLSYVEPVVEWGSGIDGPLRLLLADAQTSGGLLLALPKEAADGAVRALRERGVTEAAVIGELDGETTPDDASSCIRVRR